MRVATRLTFTTMVLLGCTATVAIVSIAGLAGLKRHFDSAHERYSQLQSLYEIGHRAATLRMLATSKQSNQQETRSQFALALREIETLRVSAVGDDELLQSANVMNERFQSASTALASDSDARAAAGQMNAALASVAEQAGRAKLNIIDNREQASAQLRTILTILSCICGGAMFLGVFVGIRQYRAITRPVRSLDNAVMKLRAANFESHIPEQGDREFRRLIQQFNSMSDEINQLHTNLQRDVQRKSEQLVRSERLASVGYLAAGIAHEINNPLGIIAGYAETTMKRLDGDSFDRDRVENSLNIISEEAFRCRVITNELLELARPTDASVERVAPAMIVRRAVSLLKALPIARDREIIICAGDGVDDVEVDGNESQLLQVMINLIKNGLEACDVGGRVTLTIHSAHGMLEIAVADNGCGMDDDVQSRAFEPFYTDKPRRGQTGTGLGLSIAHSIIHRHGGALTCDSDGAGLGSTFTIELPVAATAEALVHARA